MKKIIIMIVFLGTFLLFGVRVANSWWSVPYYSGNESTHYRLGLAAMDIIKVDAMQYMDLYKFSFLPGGKGIVPWMSGNTDDSNAHGKRYEKDYPLPAAAYNGGPFQRWWGISSPAFPDMTHGVLPQYKAFNFVSGDYSAYYYLAMMAHLVNDQAVPAHAANISHYNPVEFFSDSLFIGDNFENDASHENIKPCTGCHVTPQFKTLLGEQLFSYYNSPEKGIITVTQKELPNWKGVNSSMPFWIASNSYVGNAFDVFWGIYGPCDYINNKMYCQDYYSKSGDRHDIIQTQFKQGISYMGGFLEAASKRLPPLVKDLHISSNMPSVTPVNIDMVNGSTISFKILENRDPIVWVTIKAVEKKQSPQSETVYFIRKRSWTTLTPNGVELPYEKMFSLSSWRGELDGGGVLPDGKYTMRIELEDFDGNEVNIVYSNIGININTDDIPNNDTERVFIIDTPPPKPTNLMAFGGNGRAKITWLAPTNSDGSAVADLAGYLPRQGTVGST